MPDETPQKKIARRLLTIAALEKLLASEKTRLKSEAATLFSDPGDRAAVSLPDGTPLGNVRADPGTKAGWFVTDELAFRAWVEDTCHDAIVEKVVTTREVDPEYVAHVLDDLALVGAHTVQATGEEVVGPPPGVSYVKAGAPKLVTTADKGAPAALLQSMGAAAAQLLGIEA